MALSSDVPSVAHSIQCSDLVSHVIINRTSERPCKPDPVQSKFLNTEYEMNVGGWVRGWVGGGK